MWSRFTAQFLHAGEENGVLMVALADDDNETRRSIMFQRTEIPTPQDIALGLDGIHWMIDDEGCSGYGGIEQVTMSDEILTVTFESDTAENVRIAREISVDLALPPADLLKLRSGLQRLMP